MVVVTSLCMFNFRGVDFFLCYNIVECESQNMCTHALSYKPAVKLTLHFIEICRVIVNIRKGQNCIMRIHVI